MKALFTVLIIYFASSLAHAKCETNYKAQDISDFLNRLSTASHYTGNMTLKSISEKGQIDTLKLEGSFSVIKNGGAWGMGGGFCNDDLCVDYDSQFSTETGCLFHNDNLVTVLSASPTELSFLETAPNSSEGAKSIFRLRLEGNKQFIYEVMIYDKGAWTSSEEFEGEESSAK